MSEGKRARIDKKSDIVKNNKEIKENKNNNENKDSTKTISISNIFFKIMGAIFLIITIVFYISVWNTDMLPAYYFGIFTGIIAVITLLILNGLCRKRPKIRGNIVALIIGIIISALYIYATVYVNATMNFLVNALSESAETEDYYIVVREDSSYDEIEDIEGLTVYTFQPEEKATDKISNVVSVNFEEGESLVELGNDLVDSNIEVALFSLSQYSMLSDEIEDFDSLTKVLYSISINIKTTEETVYSEDSDYNVDNGSFNIYISGIDTSGAITNVSRSDANMIVTVNTNTHEILLTSIPRDYYVTLHSKGAKDKLTHSGIYGINETVSTVEDLLGIEINYYVRVNFTTVVDVVDALGGIEVYSDYTFKSSHINYTFTKGYNTMNGEQALAFSRERYAYVDGDNQRVKNQQNVLTAIINKVTSTSTILTKYTSILNSLEGTFQTNIEQSDISGIVKDQLATMASWTITTNSLTGTGSYGSTYSMGSTQLYIMLPDSASVAEATEKIEEVLNNN